MTMQQPGMMSAAPRSLLNAQQNTARPMGLAPTSLAARPAVAPAAPIQGQQSGQLPGFSSGGGPPMAASTGGPISQGQSAPAPRPPAPTVAVAPPLGSSATLRPLAQPTASVGAVNLGLGQAAPRAVPMWAPSTMPRLAPSSAISGQMPAMSGTAAAINPAMTAPSQSLEQQALGGGNAQQIQNFMHALNGVGAGSNNTFAASGTPSAASGSPLLGAPAAMGGNAGTVGYNSGFGDGGADPTTAGPGGSLAALPYNQNQGAGAWFATMHPGAGAAPGSDVAALPYNPNQGAGAWLAQGAGSAGVPAMHQTTTPGVGLLNSGAFSGLMSDENAKEAIAPAGDKVRSFLDAIQAHEYEYKDPQDGRGRFVSPMAQELAGTELGKSAIIETPRGMMVDYGRLSGVNLAAAADLHRRLSALERGE